MTKQRLARSVFLALTILAVFLLSSPQDVSFLYQNF